MKIILFMALISSFNAFSVDWKQLKYINGCRIYNPAGYMEKAFPGAMCIFLDNGNFISASDHSIKMFNPKNEVVWEFKGHFHHQVNLSHKNDKIFALSSEMTNGLRADTFYIFDLDGKVLQHQRATELYKMTNEPELNWHMSSLTLDGVTANREFSHFNSFYDIPALTGKNLPPWMAEGNIILNTSQSGIFILSPDMTKVLHHIKLKGSTYHRIHDVQIKPNGNFIFFNNLVAVGEPTQNFLTGLHPTMHHSAVQEIDEDKWLFTHFLTGTYIYSKSKKEMIASIPGTHADNQRFLPTQQVKAQDLKKFLSFWP